MFISYQNKRKTKTKTQQKKYNFKSWKVLQTKVKIRKKESALEIKKQKNCNNYICWLCLGEETG